MEPRPQPGDSNAVGAWFLGPQGENTSALVTFLTSALNHHINGRRNYFPEDASSIPPQMQATDAFRGNMANLQALIDDLGPKLAEHGAPFWNPRYNAHMTMDTSLPGIVGYFTAMLSNPNNVAVEASPLTTVIETSVGKDLANLVGYNIDIAEGNPIGWGHITCDGSVANLESIWAARNLKFYPLSLRLAMKKELSFIAESFVVPTCTQLPDDGSEPKLLKDFTTWELLNITPSNILDIPTRLTDQYSITPQFLQDALKPYLAQTLGKDRLEKEYDIGSMAYFASAAMHYSWPKGMAITGIGSENMIAVNVDHSARMDPEDLRRRLQECLDAKDEQGNPCPRAVYAVMAIIGSTEHGACDPLKDILDIREEFRQKGLSFVVHADGAWGTYFTTVVPQDVLDASLKLSNEFSGSQSMSSNEYHKARHDNFVPTAPLKTKTIESIAHLRFCDSITVDPHKSGYIQYPAGGLLYRDQRMRYQVTWTSPIVYRNELESIGVYGVEGSKPGAAPVATWFSHQIIGLDTKGYGQLLGETLFSAVRMYAHLATMSTSTSEFIVRPLNLLPAEMHGTPEEIEAQKNLIREKVLSVSNRELVNDADTWKLVVDMGSDLSINAFAVNFKIGDTVNEDIVEANYLNKRIFEALSITDANSDRKPDLILTSTVLSHKSYGKCLTALKDRLGLKGDQDLYTLVNVVMSPWPTATGLTTSVAQSLQDTIIKEREVSVLRNMLTDDFHAFVLQGTDEMFAVHLAMFNLENHRMQLIITGTLSSDMKGTYTQARESNPDTVYLLVHDTATTLSKILAAKEFDARIEPFSPNGRQPPIAKGKITDVKVIVCKKLNSKYLTPYPTRSMPFALYGTDIQTHIDHVYTAFPNIHMSADQVTVDNLDNDWSRNPLLYIHLPLPESAMQPFPSNYDRATAATPFFFRAGATFKNVLISKDVEGRDVVVASTTVTLGKNIFVDTDMLNEDPELKENSEGELGKTTLAAPFYQLESFVGGTHQHHASRPTRAVHPKQHHVDYVNALKSKVNAGRVV
ncbi:pyridoxal phosphate-dependent transferase [Cristinia sonorae]|uniref:Pyridoxal phosphate-dependent transferase n=1 Tax=Cristinia sonorae TaxID=1940300 RepID=A0A8K0UMS8_9AGAR|nr:pyridoxal phosphate-dependent transferase [Cristinia sonorae]